MREWAGVRARRRGRLLTRGGVPQDGCTPLNIAARWGQEAVARVLIDAGADITAKDKVCGRGRGRGQMLGETRDFGGSWQEPEKPAVNGKPLSGAER